MRRESERQFIRGLWRESLSLLFLIFPATVDFKIIEINSPTDFLFYRDAKKIQNGAKIPCEGFLLD
jgi:hypothetical protein